MKKRRWISLLMGAVLCAGAVFTAGCSAPNDPQTPPDGEQEETPYEPEVLESNGIPMGEYKIVISAEASAAESMRRKFCRRISARRGRRRPRS